MNKKKITLIIVLSIVGIAAIHLGVYLGSIYIAPEKNNEYIQRDGAMQQYFIEYSSIKKDSPGFKGYVPDADKARRIAEAFLMGSTNSSIFRPYKVEYDGTNNVWIVTGTRRATGLYIAITPIVVIKKDTGEIEFYFYRT
jgi:hypothetical protein